jgi:hypothetical protein
LNKILNYLFVFFMGIAMVAFMLITICIGIITVPIEAFKQTSELFKVLADTALGKQNQDK